MSGLARANDAALVELPREVWSRGTRPLNGRMLRWVLALTVVSFGFVFANIGIRLGMIALGAGVFFGLFPIIDGRLESIGKELGGASRSEAGKLIAGLDDRWLVSRFAPHIWVSAQKGRLNLIKGDTRAAAHAFAEAARQGGNIEQPDLVGAQAHALGLSGDLKGARQLLVGMEERKQLRPLDAFNLGVAYVEEPGKTGRAVELLESARKDMGAGPRVDAALALAYARNGGTDEATALLERLDESSFEDDDVAKGLVKRARRSLRKATDGGKPKDKRKDDPMSDDESGTGKARPKSKRDRRKDRREKRKARGKKPSKGPVTTPEPDAAEKVAAEKVAAEKVAAEKAAAEKVAAEKVAAEKVAAEKVAAETAAAEKVAAEKVAAEKVAREEAEHAARAEAEALAAQQKAESEAQAAKAAEAKAAEAQALADKQAAEAEAQAAADEQAAEAKAAADKLAEEREARAKVVAEALARSASEDDDEAQAKAAADAEAAASAAARRALEKAAARAEDGSPEKPLFGSDSRPLFVPPPVPAFGSSVPNGSAAKPKAPSIPAPPRVAAPKVAAPPVVASGEAKSTVDTDGWDDLFGDD